MKTLWENDEVKAKWEVYISDMIDGYEALHTSKYAQFVTEVESPAIERANKVMQNDEPSRSTEYREGTYPFTSLRDKLDMLLTEKEFMRFGYSGLSLTFNDHILRFNNGQRDQVDIRTFDDLVTLTS